MIPNEIKQTRINNMRKTRMKRHDRRIRRMERDIENSERDIENSESLIENLTTRNRLERENREARSLALRNTIRLQYGLPANRD